MQLPIVFVNYGYIPIRHNAYIFSQPYFSTWSMLSVREYLHEKAAESRHNEMSAYLMFIAGSILFVGGILETLVVAEEVDWVLFLPVGFSAEPGCILGLALTLSGLALVIFGLVTGTYFAQDRGWYMRELHSASYVEEGVISRKKRNANSRAKAVDAPPKSS